MSSSRSKELALIAAIVSTLVVWIVWAAFEPIPLIEDEYSYVLQSRIFATGHWSVAAPPIPEFFQQAHVLTVPRVASKFFPGHALLMSIGSFLGNEALIPLLLTGLSAALLFLLMRRVTNDWVAGLTILVWLSDPLNLRYRAAYYSEVTSEMMWLISWWALLEWRQSRERRWLLVLAAAIGWGAITRPLTMLAFAVPVGFIVVRDVIRTKKWADFGLATAVGVVILAIIPLWSAKTTGNWRLTPQSLYTQDYLPYDHPGFGVDKTLPRLKLNPVNQYTYAGFYGEHVKHTPARLPRVAFERLSAIAHEEWSGARLALVPFVILGLFSMTPEIVFALVCALALFVGYLSYGHWAQWTLYYFEGLPILSALAALGLWRAIEFVRVQASMRDVRVIATTAAVLLVALDIAAVHRARFEHLRTAGWDTSFQQALTTLPTKTAVIFVRFAPTLRPHANVVLNSPHLDEEPIWIVNDLGERDRDLLKYAGQRVPLIFDETTGKFDLDRRLLSR